jgi:hypothetical protein
MTDFRGVDPVQITQTVYLYFVILFGLVGYQCGGAFFTPLGCPETSAVDGFYHEIPAQRRLREYVAFNRNDDHVDGQYIFTGARSLFLFISTMMTDTERPSSTADASTDSTRIVALTGLTTQVFSLLSIAIDFEVVVVFRYPLS